MKRKAPHALDRATLERVHLTFFINIFIIFFSIITMSQMKS